MANQEKSNHSTEGVRTSEVFRDSLENEQRKEALHEALEQSTAEGSHEDLESVRKEVLKHASEKEKPVHKEKEILHGKVDRRKDGPISKSERNASYKRTMKQVESELSAPSRAFSKLIHNKTVEKVSDVVGGSVARPNAILTGAGFAFAFSLILLLVARHNGYPLSGTETIAGFAIGWAVGILFDYIRIMITGKTS